MAHAGGRPRHREVDDPDAGERARGADPLVVSFQGRAEGTDAFCTLEAIQRVAQPPVRHVTEALVDALRHPG